MDNGDEIEMGEIAEQDLIVGGPIIINQQDD